MHILYIKMEGSDLVFLFVFIPFSLNNHFREDLLGLVIGYW